MTRLSLAVAFWTAVAAVFVMPRLGQSHDPVRVLLSALAQWWAWGLLVPAIVACDRALRLPIERIAPRVAAYLLAGPCFAVAYSYVEATLRALFDLASWRTVLARGVLAESLHEMFWSMLVYSLILCVWKAYEYHQRWVSAAVTMERLERTLSDARLQALRTQLDPHFLFNALNTIASHVEDAPAAARSMIEHLGSLMRLSLDSLTVHKVPITEELTFLEHYLAIQHMRFGDRIQVTIDVDSNLRDALVPSLFLQPLVENAFKHGLSKRARGGSIVVQARRRQNAVHIAVQDDGEGLPLDWTLNTHVGTGLSVTRKRCTALYPEGTSELEVRRRDDGGTEVLIKIPFESVEGQLDRRR